MANISEVIEFSGSVDDLVWKSPVEDFNTTSVLIVDETHRALVLVNGVQYGLYGPGRHVLETPNIPGARRLINIPTGGKTSFPCKVFYVNMLHQMAMEWGVPGNIKLEDPVYHVFMDIGARGTVNFVVTDCIKFMEKLVGFRDRFDPAELTNLDNGKFRGIISKWVTSDISKFMISGGVSYFTISENLFEISEIVKDQLSKVFEEYGVGVQDFVIDAVVAGSDNVQELAEAKRTHAARKIQGFTWKDERKMTILETAAGNSGIMGGMQGAVGGFMMGGAMGSSLTDILRGVLNSDGTGNGRDDSGTQTVTGNGIYKKVDPMEFFKNGMGKPVQIDPQNSQPSGMSFANPQPAAPGPAEKPSGMSFANPQPAAPGPAEKPSGMSFANPQPAASVSAVTVEKSEESAPALQETYSAAPRMRKCSGCSREIPAEYNFCPYCATPAPKTCPVCGMEVSDTFAFCPKCGKKL